MDQRKILALEILAPASWRCLIMLLVSAVTTAGMQTPRRSETSPILKVQNLAPATLLNGIGFHVDDSVQPTGSTRSARCLDHARAQCRGRVEDLSSNQSIE
jgi:hypothetical protein